MTEQDQETLARLPRAPKPAVISLPATSRRRVQPSGSEEAGAVLRLGEFEDAEPLSISEANLVMTALAAKRVAEKKFINNTDMLSETLEYLDAFSRFKGKETVEAVERLLSSHPELHKFERAQLGSLCPETAEEAKTLVPSLTYKISDDTLQELLDRMYELMEPRGGAVTSGADQ